MNPRTVTRDSVGRYRRSINIWTPEKWNEGYYDNKGRFRVYRPDYPRAYKGGYALRAHVVWWLNTGIPHPVRTELHHKDGTKDNDRFENLIPLTNSQHQLVHRENKVIFVCKNCKKEFSRHKWRVDQRGAKFCSYKCYSEYPKESKRINRKCVECGAMFTVIPSSKKKLCSQKCSAIHTWRNRHAYSD